MRGLLRTAYCGAAERRSPFRVSGLGFRVSVFGFRLPVMGLSHLRAGCYGVMSNRTVGLSEAAAVAGRSDRTNPWSCLAVGKSA